MQKDLAPATTSAPIVETKTLFRADTDQHGDWYVWRKLSQHGWATMRRCGSQEAALELAEAMNRDPHEAIFRG